MSGNGDFLPQGQSLSSKNSSLVAGICSTVDTTLGKDLEDIIGIEGKEYQVVGILRETPFGIRYLA